MLFRFEIEKKLRQQKKKEQKKKEKGMVPSAQELKDLKSASQRSMERRKNMEEKKDNKKFSALTDLMKKREEKKKIGIKVNFLLLPLTPPPFKKKYFTLWFLLFCKLKFFI